jgi:hypothetical protein
MSLVKLENVAREHAEYLANVKVEERNCGFLYLLHLRGSPLYKIGSANRKSDQSVAVQKRFRAIDKQCQEDGLVLEHVRILPVHHVVLPPEKSSSRLTQKMNSREQRILALNEEKITLPWLDGSAQEAEYRWHRRLHHYRVDIPGASRIDAHGKERRIYTEFFNFNPEEAVAICEAYESGQFPGLPPHSEPSRKLVWTLRELRPQQRGRTK